MDTSRPLTANIIELLELDAYIERQEAGPSVTSVTQSALREFLAVQRLKELEHRPAPGPIKITPAEPGSGRYDIGIDHDRYLAEPE
ncbi:MAG: hypothetical protein WD314_04110 [Trueperaceae bacterium]